MENFNGVMWGANDCALDTMILPYNSSLELQIGPKTASRIHCVENRALIPARLSATRQVPKNVKTQQDDWRRTKMGLLSGVVRMNAKNRSTIVQNSFWLVPERWNES